MTRSAYGTCDDDTFAQRVYVNAAGASSPTPTLLYHVRDANHNLVTLTDVGGNPVARYGYTPFGVPRWAEVVATELIEANPTPAPTSTSIAAARLNRIGHQAESPARSRRASTRPSVIRRDASFRLR